MAKIRTPGAERAFRHRQRRREQRDVYRVVTHRRTVEILIAVGRISEEDSHDRAKVADAIAWAVDLWAQGLA